MVKKEEEGVGEMRRKEGVEREGIWRRGAIKKEEK